MPEKDVLSAVFVSHGLQESECPASSARSIRVFVDRDLRAEIRPDLGGRVELTWRDGLIGLLWRGWHVSFGPGTPTAVIAGAVRAARDSLTPEALAEAGS
ncbi:hypothetical protein ACFYZ2_33270 [Streptomyces sviceus]|uniref:hypothetical protein n=1 Tax=Streptomyces TaxID=1883 RepID=UPI0036756415